MAAKKSAKKAAKPADAPEKTPAKKAAKKKPATKAAKAAKELKAAPLSLEAVARGAYLNYRRRVENGLPGDTDGDWLEAERQLRAAEV